MTQKVLAKRVGIEAPRAEVIVGEVESLEVDVEVVGDVVTGAGLVLASIPSPAGGCFSISVRISAAAGVPWKHAAPPTRCAAIAKADERLLVLALAELLLNFQRHNFRSPLARMESGPVYSWTDARRPEPFTADPSD